MNDQKMAQRLRCRVLDAVRGVSDLMCSLLILLAALALRNLVFEDGISACSAVMA